MYEMRHARLEAGSHVRSMSFLTDESERARVCIWIYEGGREKGREEGTRLVVHYLSMIPPLNVCSELEIKETRTQGERAIL